VLLVSVLLEESVDPAGSPTLPTRLERREIETTFERDFLWLVCKKQPCFFSALRIISFTGFK
jgi:hypothetical protein